eukprot:2897290-Amphidinium_carterae.1
MSIDEHCKHCRCCVCTQTDQWCMASRSKQDPTHTPKFANDFRTRVGGIGHSSAKATAEADSRTTKVAAVAGNGKSNVLRVSTKVSLKTTKAERVSETTKVTLRSGKARGNGGNRHVMSEVSLAMAAAWRRLTSTSTSSFSAL